LFSLIFFIFRESLNLL